jgi:Lrp/AsnC family leucine-responsive transcriptional regulator
MNLDLTDKKLINLLQNDGKITAKELSNELNLSVTAIYERIKKLEKNKVIKKYIAVINKDKIDRNYIVFCQVRLIQHHKKYIEKFEKEVPLFNEVLECFNTSGDYDYQLKIVVKNMKAYRDFLNNKLTTLDYIGSTHSTFVISKVKDTNAIILN